MARDPRTAARLAGMFAGICIVGAAVLLWSFREADDTASAAVGMEARTDPRANARAVLELAPVTERPTRVAPRENDVEDFPSPAHGTPPSPMRFRVTDDGSCTLEGSVLPPDAPGKVLRVDLSVVRYARRGKVVDIVDADAQLQLPAPGPFVIEGLPPGLWFAAARVVTDSGVSWGRSEPLDLAPEEPVASADIAPVRYAIDATLKGAPAEQWSRVRLTVDARLTDRIARDLFTDEGLVGPLLRAQGAAAHDAANAGRLARYRFSALGGTWRDVRGEPLEIEVEPDDEWASLRSEPVALTVGPEGRAVWQANGPCRVTLRLAAAAGAWPECTWEVTLTRDEPVVAIGLDPIGTSTPPDESR